MLQGSLEIICYAIEWARTNGGVDETIVAVLVLCDSDSDSLRELAADLKRLGYVFEATKSPIAEEGLRRTQQLYAIEADINSKSAELRLAQRQAQSVPLLDGLHVWYREQRRRLSSKSTLGKALQYALSRWDALTRYTTDGSRDVCP